MAAGDIVPQLPSGFRFPAPSSELYAINLITALLSSRPDGLSWLLLRDAFVAATRPDLLCGLALPDDSDRASEWASRWNETAGPDTFIPALRTMSGANIAVSGSGVETVFSLQDGSQEPSSDDVAYDAWLALRVVEPLTAPIMTESEEGEFNVAIEELLARI